MPVYVVTAPDGNEYEIEGEGTPEQALAHFQENWAQQHPPGALQTATDLLRDPLRDVPYVGQGSTFDDVTDAVARAGASVVGGIPDLAELAYRFGKSKVTGDPMEHGPLFSDTIKHVAGIGATPTTETGKVVDEYLPWVLPSTAGKARALGAAPAFLDRVGNVVTHGVGGVIDKTVAETAQQAAKDAGYDEAGQIAAAVAGSAARPVAQRAAGAIARPMLAKPNAGEIFDAGERQGINPTFGMLTGPTGQSVEKGLGALPFVGSPVDRARGNVLQQTEEALANATGQPHITQPGDIGQGFIEAAQQRQTQRRAGASAEQGAIEAAIGPQTPTDVSPVLNVIDQRAGPGPGTGDPGVGEPFKRRARALRPDLENDIEAMNPGSRQNREVWQSEADRVRQENYDADVAHQNEVQRLNDQHAQAVAASQGPVTLTGTRATDYVTSLAGTLTPKQLFDLNVKLKSAQSGGRGGLIVNPGDPGYAGVAPAAPARPTLPPRPIARPEPVVPPPETTAGYGAIKDERSLLREQIEGSPRMTVEHAQPYYDAHTESMRDAAVATPAVGGDRFDAAMQDYANLQNTEVPWLGNQGGFQRPGGQGFEAVPTQNAIASRLRRAVGPNETFLQEAADPNIGGIPDATGDAVSAIIRGFGREGRVDPSIRPDRLAADLSGVNDTAAGMIPGGPGAVRDLQTTGEAYGQPRDQNRLTKATALGPVIAKMANAVTAPLAAVSAGAIESEPILRAMAGRTQYSPLVQQMLTRAGMAGNKALP